MEYIQPEILSEINSRKDTNPFIDGKLPIISAPMYSVYDNTGNFNRYFLEDLSNHMYITIPRETDHLNFSDMWTSIDLDDFEYMVNETKELSNMNILVDIANGHMEKLYNLTKVFLENFPNCKLIVGNIANPKTYEKYAELGVWGVRCGIGTGSVCETTTNTGVHYPSELLIPECYKIKKTGNFKTKIIADGGIRSTRDINLRLSWGADLVMLGGMLTQTLESNNTPYLFKTIPINNKKVAIWLFENGYKLHKKHQGMSTIEVQKKWGRLLNELRHSEGKTDWYSVKYTASTLTYDIESAIRSVLSYTGLNNLEDFIGYNVDIS